MKVKLDESGNIVGVERFDRGTEAAARVICPHQYFNAEESCKVCELMEEFDRLWKDYENLLYTSLDIAGEIKEKYRGKKPPKDLPSLKRFYKVTKECDKSAERGYGCRLIWEKTNWEIRNKDKKCPYGDPYCPCQDGDPCNHEEV